VRLYIEYANKTFKESNIERAKHPIMFSIFCFFWWYVLPGGCNIEFSIIYSSIHFCSITSFVQWMIITRGTNSKIVFSAKSMKLFKICQYNMKSFIYFHCKNNWHAVAFSTLGYWNVQILIKFSRIVFNTITFLVDYHCRSAHNGLWIMKDWKTGHI
jgi:hypothetical protein